MDMVDNLAIAATNVDPETIPLGCDVLLHCQMLGNQEQLIRGRDVLLSPVYHMVSYTPSCGAGL